MRTLTSSRARRQLDLRSTPPQPRAGTPERVTCSTAGSLRSTRRRLDRAHARIDRGERPAPAEFDAIRGLAGIGAGLLHSGAQEEPLRAVLQYLVRLTEPLVDADGRRVPGWCSDLGPTGRPSPAFGGGHVNNGMAHGIGGPLALLSSALLAGVRVDGQVAAIQRICTWLDTWRQDDGERIWWPYWVTPDQIHAGALDPMAPPGRPSWCYGTAGLARAQQLAAIATSDVTRQRMSEDAVRRAVVDPLQKGGLVDRSLCHGWAGLAHVGRRMAADAGDRAVRRPHPGRHR